MQKKRMICGSSNCGSSDKVCVFNLEIMYKVELITTKGLSSSILNSQYITIYIYMKIIIYILVKVTVICL